MKTPVSVLEAYPLVHEQRELVVEFVGGHPHRRRIATWLRLRVIAIEGDLRGLLVCEPGDRVVEIDEFDLRRKRIAM